MSEDTPNMQLPVIQNRAPESMVLAQRQTSLSRLFRVKPKTLELVAKSTTKDGAVPGTFRVTSTNEKFTELRAVILVEPQEQREMYKKGEYSKDSKLCFSLDNVQPHPKAKNPPAMYCATCPMGDINWKKWSAAKAKGISGVDLQAYMPPCKKYWHLFIAARDTQRLYYFNVKGLGVGPFEQAMSNMADLFQMIIQSIKVDNKEKIARGEAPLALPTTVADLIWHISFTMYAFQKSGGPFIVGLKDFAVMKPEDRAEFGAILEDYKKFREAGQVQSQESSEAEEEAMVMEGKTSSIPTAQAEVIQQNAQIEI